LYGFNTKIKKQAFAENQVLC